MKNKVLIFINLLPVIFSLLLLSAHFSRNNITVLTYFCLLLPLALLIKHHISARFIQLILLLGTVEWLRTLFSLASQRMDDNQPWIRLVVILAVVAIFTLASVLVFYSKKLKNYYQIASVEN